MRCTPKPIHCAILVVVLITSIAVCGCTSSNPPASTATTQTQVPGAPTVNIQNFAFIPASITVPSGTTVTWTNQDSTDHPDRQRCPGISCPGSDIFKQFFTERGELFV